MKEHLAIIKISIIIGLVSVLMATVFEFRLDKYLYANETILAGHREFIINTLLGIFTGAFLTVGVSIISFFARMRSSLFEFWASTEIFWQKVTLFASKHFPHGAEVADVISHIEKSPTLYDESFSLRVDYSNLIKIHREIRLFRRDAEIKKLIDQILDYVGKVNEEITCMCYLQIDSTVEYQTKIKYVTAFEHEDSNLKKLITKCRELQTKLNISFKMPECLEENPMFGGQNQH